MTYTIVTYGNDVLREKAGPVEDPTSLKELAADMLETMKASHGLGLAAEQIGRTEAICVVDIPAEFDVEEEGGPRDNPDVEMPLIMINPTITDSAGKQTCQEGCLSFPEIFVPVTRADEVRVVFSDTDGVEHDIDVRGLLSRAIQHEIDHLHGVLLVDRMSAVKKVALAGKLKKLRKAAN